ncbi:MAG: substrate-binding domain-containing protein [Chloroflexi bacterium]|nr:substrate-binding domain-containing protein [Chloroflexota bacterium]
MAASSAPRPPPEVNLGHLIKSIGISREEVATRVDVSKDAINSWCSGRSRVDLRHLSRLVLVLREAGIPPGQLLDLVFAQLARYGMTGDIVRLLRDAGQPSEHGPVFLLGSHLNSGSHQLLARGLYDALRAGSGTQVVNLDSRGRPDILEYYLTLTLQSRAGGVIIALSPFQEYRFHKLDEVAQQLASHEIPCVFVNTGLPAPPPGAGIVQIDDYRAGVMATEILWARGHRDIYAIAADRRIGQPERVQGYCDAMRRSGGTPRVLWTLAQDGGGQPSAAADRPDTRVAAELAAADAQVSAILAFNADVTKEVLRALRQRGRTPGKDISIMAMGCWDWMHDIALPPITHVALPYYEAGQQAGRLLQVMTTRDLPASERTVVISLTADALHGGDGGSVTRLP